MNFDMDTANQAFEVARHGAGAMNALIGTFDRLKTLVQSPKPAPPEEIRAIIVDLGEKVMKAREENVMLREQIIGLRDQIIEMKRREEKFAGYELMETDAGAIVMRSGKGVQPVHYLCPTCHDAGVKTILQGDDSSKQCTASPSHGWFDFKPPPAPMPRDEEFY